MGKTVTTTWKRGRQHVVPGTEMSIKGMRGRVRFRQHVVLDDGREWVDVIGAQGFASYRPERVRAVHRIAKLRPGTVKGAQAVAA